MPYSPHYRVTAIGEIRDAGGLPIEIFSYGFSYGQPGTHPDLAEPLSFINVSGQPGTAQRVVDLVKAFHGREATQINPNAVLTSVKVAPIGTNGKYLSPPFERSTDNQAGGNNPANLRPPQIAQRVSLRGPVALKRVRGGFYLPLPGVAASAYPRMNSGLVQGQRNSLKTLIDALNTDSPVHKVIVASSKGFNARVEEIAVGDVLDTIRSRRNGIEEQYQVADITT